MVNVGTTKIQKNNQTTIPSKIRKDLNVTGDTLVNWNLNMDKTVTVIFENKKPSIHDLAGIGRSEELTNAVELKRTLYK